MNNFFLYYIMNPNTAKEQRNALLAELKQKQQQQSKQKYTFKAPIPRPRPRKKLSAKKKGPTVRTAATRTGRTHERENRRVNHSPSSSFERGSRSRTPIKGRPKRNSSSVNSITGNMEQRDIQEREALEAQILRFKNPKSFEQYKLYPKTGFTQKEKEKLGAALRNEDNRRVPTKEFKKKQQLLEQQTSGDDEVDRILKDFQSVYSDKVTALTAVNQTPLAAVNQTPLEHEYARVPPSFLRQLGDSPVPIPRPHTYAEVSEGKKKKKRKGSTKGSTNKRKKGNKASRKGKRK
jgi:hypothetical protein